MEDSDMLTTIAAHIIADAIKFLGRAILIGHACHNNGSNSEYLIEAGLRALRNYDTPTDKDVR